MNTLETGKALLSSITEEPLNLTPRLVYADWLEEYGGQQDQARAEFIRLQIQNDGVDQVHPSRDREWALLNKWNKLWDPWTHVGVFVPTYLKGLKPLHLSSCGYRKGFVESVNLWGPGWLRAHKELRGLTPLTQVTLTGGKPAYLYRPGPGGTRIYYFEFGNSRVRLPRETPQKEVFHAILKAEWPGIEFTVIP